MKRPRAELELESSRQVALLALSQDALETNDLGRLREHAIRAILTLLGAERVAFYDLDALTGEARLTASQPTTGFAAAFTMDVGSALDRVETRLRAGGGDAIAIMLAGHERAREILVVQWTDRVPQAGRAFVAAVGNIVAIAATRLRVENALRERETLSTLGTLLAGIAHEINDPLSYIQANLELANLALEERVRSGGLPEADRILLSDVCRQLETTGRGVAQITLIAKGLKQVAKGGTGARSLASLSDLAETALLVATPRFAPQVIVDASWQASSHVRGDGNDISRAILNVLLNAGEALEGRASPRVRVRTLDEGRCCVLEVQDNGPGVPEPLHRSLFTPFVTSKPQGTGLGLSISRRILHDHGGSLTFETKPGVGTTFRLALPSVRP